MSWIDQPSIMTKQGTEAVAWDLAMSGREITVFGIPVFRFVDGGDTLWLTALDGDVRSGVVTSEGEIYVVSDHRLDPASANFAFAITRLDQDGSVMWENTFVPVNPMSDGWSMQVIENPRGGILASTLSTLEPPKMVLVSVDTNGNLRWRSSQPAELFVGVRQYMPIALTDTGEVVQLTDTADGLRLVRTDLDGDLVSDIEFEMVAGSEDLIALPGGDLIVVARNLIGGYILARVDAEGSFVWMRESETTVVTMDADPTPLVAGAFEVNAGAWDPKSELLFLAGSHRTEDNDFLPYRMAMNATGETLCEWTGEAAAEDQYYCLSAVAPDSGGAVLSWGNVLERITFEP